MTFAHTRTVVNGFFHKIIYLRVNSLCVYKLRACLHRGGGTQVGEVTRSGGVTRLYI